MKRTISGIMLMLLLTSLSAFAFNIRRVVATTSTLSVKPPTIIDPSLTPDNTLIINCSVENVIDLFVWQIKLFFDPITLNCTGAWYPSDHVFVGKTFVPVVPIIDNSVGYVLYGCSLMGAVAGFEGGGTLCQIEFDVKSIGKSGFNYSEPYGEDTYILDSNLDEISAEMENGYFSNVPAPPIEYTLTITSAVGGTTDPSPDTYTYAEGTAVVVTAIPDAGYYFDHWELDGVNYIITPITVTMNANHTLHVVFTTEPPPEIIGDINGDGKVDMKDIGIAGKAFGSYPEHQNWNADADVNLNQKVDLIDIALIARNFGRTL